MKVPTMQFVALFAKPDACVQEFVSQAAMQLSENPLGPPMHPKAHVRICSHVCKMAHCPQSAWQELHVSPALASQMPFPQKAHVPQSAGHDTHVSFCAQ